MKAIQITETNRDLKSAIESLKIVEKPIPKPKPGQVLIKVEAAPCNPSDLLFLQGMYGTRKTLPAVPGWEGAGTVVESNAGLLGFWLKGKRVACGGQSDNDGTWAEYYIADAKACIPLNKNVSSQQGSTLIINPLTAIGMIEQAKKEGHLAIVQTAACIQVGRMVQTIAKQKNIPLINIVRRQDQVDELLITGEKFVLNSEENNFKENFTELAKKLKATIVFEAIGGAMTGKILHMMPVSSKALVYGALSEKPCDGISPIELIFQKRSVEGFWLSEWIKRQGFIHTFKSTRYIQQLIGSGAFETKIHAAVPFEKWKESLLSYTENMTKGKVILTPE